MNRIYLLLTGIFLFVYATLTAQPFEQYAASVQGVGRSAVAWGDYDNDGDLDFVLCGMTQTGSYLSLVYENIEGIFTASDAELQGVKDGSVAWGDFDNDNDLDILLTGETEANGNISLIYVNADGKFTEYDAGLPAIAYGQAVWGDYDMDGDLDILIAGTWIVEIYQNDEGVFALTENDFVTLQNSRGTWGDFDNDGDLDILLTGDTGGGYFADIYINDMGSFSRANFELPGLFSGSADLIDFDNDGDLDISITGYDIYLEPLFLTYKNNGDGSIAAYPNYMTGIVTSSVDWGDYDNDGDLDVLMCGKNAACGGSVSQIYNNDNGVFMLENEASLQGAIRSDAAWADFDNDGDLDLILSGMTASEVPFTNMFINVAGENHFMINTPPEAPTNLTTMVEGQTVIFSWDKATDEQTPQDGLNYNIRLGTYPGGSDVISPMADPESGYRIIQSLGNTNMQNSWMISRLKEDTYYWSVQTIDQAYSGSEFAEEGSFAIVATGMNDLEQSNSISVFPNPATNNIFVYSANTSAIEFKMYNVNGQQLLEGSTTAGQAIDISSLKEGIYFIRLNTDDGLSIQRLIKQ